MYTPKQRGPIVNSTSSFSATAIQPSDCPNGDLFVYFPQGGQSVIPGAVPCCYAYPNCNPCDRPPSHWNPIIGNAFPSQCGPNNQNGCAYSPACRSLS